MNDLLSYLRQYVPDPKVFSTLRFDDPLMAKIPQWWQDALSAVGDDRVGHILRAWESFQEQLPQVYSFLVANLKDVYLLTNKDHVSNSISVRLLYELKGPGRILYYAGGNPLNKPMPELLRGIWPKLPDDFRRFYDVVHNGWYYLASNAMGPSPVEDFFFLDDVEWGILDDIEDPGCNLKDLLAIYSNGMGSYVALSVDRGEYGDVLWWKDKPPRKNIETWTVIDSWTQLGLNN